MRPSDPKLRKQRDTGLYEDRVGQPAPSVPASHPKSFISGASPCGAHRPCWQKGRGHAFLPAVLEESTAAVLGWGPVTRPGVPWQSGQCLVLTERDLGGSQGETGVLRQLRGGSKGLKSTTPVPVLVRGVVRGLNPAQDLATPHSLCFDGHCPSCPRGLQEVGLL